MSEFEIIKILTDSGISFVAVVGLGFLLYKVDKTLCDVVKSDQESRERNTIALTKLESSIDEFRPNRTRDAWRDLRANEILGQSPSIYRR